MFDAFKTAGALAGLMKNKEGLREAGERIKSRLAELRAAGAAGGGAVRATVSGDMKVTDITLEPALVAGLEGGDAARLYAQSLIAEAINNALDQAKALAQREMAKEAEGLGLGNIPGLEKLLGG